MDKLDHPPAGTWDVIDRHGEPRYVVEHDGKGGWWSVCQPDRPEDCYVLAASKDLLDVVNDFLHGYCVESSNEFRERRSDLAYKMRMAKNKAEGK